MVILILLCLGGCQSAADVNNLPIPTSGLKAMSFNIRWPNPDDGANRWDLRRELVVRTIQRQSPDVLGVQEALAFQAAYLSEQLPGYTMVGVGRDDGNQQGEMTAIFFRSERFTLEDHGHFWLSDTPDIVGSVGWDAALTRMVTWLLLVDHQTQTRWLVLNTHFDHAGQQARHESAKLIGRFILGKQGELGDALAIIVMGDFNSAVDSPAYRALCVDAESPRLVDTYAATNPTSRRGNEGTFNGFRGRQNGARIDWILVSNNQWIQSVQIDRYMEDRRYPSDHFPVTATVLNQP